MAFKRNLDDPIQRKRQALDDRLNGKRTKSKLVPTALKEPAKVAEAPKTAPKAKVVTKKKGKS